MLRQRGYITEGRTRQKVHLKWDKEYAGWVDPNTKKKVYDYVAKTPLSVFRVTTTAKKKGWKATKRSAWMIRKYDRKTGKMDIHQWVGVSRQFLRKDDAFETVEKFVAEHEPDLSDQRSVRKKSKKLEWFKTDDYVHRANIGDGGYFEVVGEVDLEKRVFVGVKVYKVDSSGKRKLIGKGKMINDGKIIANREHKK